ncbi:MAG: DUF4397 domain-containing protein [Woeseiaceae bacterium]|nr:DUF4397 domain-containing protein [Woeseiaceae bacterium]
MKARKLLTLTAAVLALSACDSDDGAVLQQVIAPQTFDLQVLHASSNAPAVNVIFGGNEVLSGVDYKEGSPRLTIDVGTYSVQVDGILPDNTATVIGPVDIDFAADTTYTIAAVGRVGDMTNPLEPVVLEQPRTPVAAGSARAFVLHGASAAPRVDVYVTAPGADLAATAPLGTFSYKETLGPVEVAAGDYQIRVTAAGDPTAVVFDTGALTLNDGDDLLLSAVNNTSPTNTNFFGTPISLVALTGAGSAEILDAATPAAVRVIHASPDAPNVDVVANDAVTLVSDLAFPNAAGPLSVDAASYEVDVNEAGNAGNPVITAQLALDAGNLYDVFAVGNLAGIEALVAADDYRRIATAAKLRLVHASPTAQGVDIYLTAPQADINNETPTFENVPFPFNTGFVEVTPETYDVTITPTGTKTPAIGPLTITLEPEGVYTAVARDENGGGAVAATPILLDDFLQ